MKLRDQTQPVANLSNSDSSLTDGPFHVKIRVFYPLSAGRIGICLDDDWEKEIKPTHVSGDNNRFDFHITAERPYLYFKPYLTDDNGGHWSQGLNHLAVMDGSILELYPYFYSKPLGKITEVTRITSSRLGRDYFARAYLPGGYEENTLKRYPVIYMHDGSNLFFPEEAFLHREWMVDETLDVLDQMNIIDDVIVVGVYAHDRMNEYTAPGYYDYGRFLVEELKTRFDARFRTLTGPRATAVLGSSLGGVVSLFLAWEWPHVFGKAACLSSTFTYHDDLMERIRKDPKRAIKLYLDSGWPGDNFERTLAVRDLLYQKGFRWGEDLLYFAFPNAAHDESFWAARLHIPFQYFFGKTRAFG